LHPGIHQLSPVPDKKKAGLCRLIPAPDRFCYRYFFYSVRD
jgi:hypothetical protein